MEPVIHYNGETHRCKASAYTAPELRVEAGICQACGHQIIGTYNDLFFKVTNMFHGFEADYHAGDCVRKHFHLCNEHWTSGVTSVCCLKRNPINVKRGVQ